MRRLPPLSAIEAFVTVAREGSLKVAAEMLALSSPALSRRLQSLEQHLGKPLFDRRHKRLALNADGAALLETLAPALATLTDAIAEARAPAAVQRVHLGIPPLFAAQKLFPALPDLRARHPEIHLDIDTGAHAVTRLGDALDAAIILSDQPDPSLHIERLDRNLVCAIASAGYLEREGIATPADLSRATILVHHNLADMLGVWLAALGEVELKPAAIDLYDSGQLILDAAARELGIALMHRSHFDSAHDERLVRVFDTISIESPYSYWFVCRPRALEQRAVKLFRDWLIEAVADVA